MTVFFTYRNIANNRLWWAREMHEKEYLPKGWRQISLSSSLWWRSSAAFLGSWCQATSSRIWRPSHGCVQGFLQVSDGTAAGLRHEGPWPQRLHAWLVNRLDLPLFRLLISLLLRHHQHLHWPCVIHLPGCVHSALGPPPVQRSGIPIFSSDLFTANGRKYDSTSIVSKKFEIDVNSYRKPGKVNLSILYLYSLMGSASPQLLPQSHTLVPFMEGMASQLTTWKVWFICSL